MKTYKTWEAIKAIEENEKLEFENSHGTIIKYENLVIRFFDKDGKNIKRYRMPLDTQWTLIQKPVPFMEAIKALNEGKNIYCEIDSGKLHYQTGSSLNGYYAVLDEFEGPITTKEILQGKWYIEED